MKTELELSEMYWKNPEYNERMSFAAFKKLAAVLSESTRPVEDVDNTLKKQCVGIVNQLYDLAEVSVDKRQSINDISDDYLIHQFLRLFKDESEHMDVPEGKKEE